MPVIDKAVSTEDLCTEEVSPALGVLRLEAILNTLVENKVEALKQENEKSSSLHASPKTILQKLKYHSSPKTTLKIEDEKKKNPKRKDKNNKNYGHKVVSESRHFKRQVLRQETSSPDSQVLHADEKCPGNGQQYKSSSCMESSCQSHICYCSHGPAPMQVTDDYISIRMDGFGDIETDAIIAQEEIKRAKRKRRRRRKRILKKRLALNSHLVDALAHDSEFKSLHDDELPPRAKWTIVATACLLLFMCLLLVGITLRMAPIIDEIVQLSALSVTMSSTESVGAKNISSTSLRKIVCKDLSYNLWSSAESSCNADTFLRLPKSKDAPRKLKSTIINSNNVSEYSPRENTFCIEPQQLFFQGRKRLQRTTSLEEIYKKQKKSKQQQRRKSENYFKYSDISINRKRSSKTLKKKCTTRGIHTHDIEKGFLELGPIGRLRLPSEASAKSTSSSGRLSRQISSQHSKEYTTRQKRRKIIINIILGVFVSLFCISILSVVVTLTHTSTTTIFGNNSTKKLTYYTFSSNPYVPYEDNR